MDHAQVDLRLLRRLREDPVEPIGVCFHAQQAVEKALKAIIAAVGEDPPRTHDIGALMDRLQQWDAVRTFPRASELTRWATDSRYPLTDQAPTADEAERAAEVAERFVEAVQRDLARFWRLREGGQ